ASQRGVSGAKATDRKDTRGTIAPIPGDHESEVGTRRVHGGTWPPSMPGGIVRPGAGGELQHAVQYRTARADTSGDERVPSVGLGRYGQAPTCLWHGRQVRP